MKNYLIVGLACLLVAFVFSIDPIKRLINEITQNGTLRGADICMSYTNSGLLSEGAVKATCINAFQKELYNEDLATGLAGPRIKQEIVSWAGNLQNKTSDHVTTGITISVLVFDSDGNETNYEAETPIWIEPLSEETFDVEIPELEPEKLKDINGCEYEDTQPRECLAWSIVKIMGLAI